jgi:hypothetical protein
MLVGFPLNVLGSKRHCLAAAVAACTNRSSARGPLAPRHRLYRLSSHRHSIRQDHGYCGNSARRCNLASRGGLYVVERQEACLSGSEIDPSLESLARPSKRKEPRSKQFAGVSCALPLTSAEYRAVLMPGKYNRQDSNRPSSSRSRTHPRDCRDSVGHYPECRTSLLIVITSPNLTRLLREVDPAAKNHGSRIAGPTGTPEEILRAPSTRPCFPA